MLFVYGDAFQCVFGMTVCAVNFFDYFPPGPVYDVDLVVGVVRIGFKQLVQIPVSKLAGVTDIPCGEHWNIQSRLITSSFQFAYTSVRAPTAAGIGLCSASSTAV